MCYVIMRRSWNEDYGYDGCFDYTPVCCFDDRDRAEDFLKSHGLNPDKKGDYESKYCRGKDKMPDVYFIKEIPYNDDNLEGTYENSGQTYIPFNL